MHAEKNITDYWRPKITKKETTKPQDIKNGFVIVHSNIDIDKLKPVEDKKVLLEKPKNELPKVNKKKKSVADAIQTSLKTKQNNSTEGKENNLSDTLNKSPVNVPNKSPVNEISASKVDRPVTNLHSPKKILSQAAPQSCQPSSRFSLPIHNDCYVDYHSGNTVAVVAVPEAPFTIDQTGDWSCSDWSSSTGSIFDGYRDDYSVSSTESEKKPLNINSDLDFPPLS